MATTLRELELLSPLLNVTIYPAGFTFTTPSSSLGNFSTSTQHFFLVFTLPTFDAIFIVSATPLPPCFCLVFFLFLSLTLELILIPLPETVVSHILLQNISFLLPYLLFLHYQPKKNLKSKFVSCPPGKRSSTTSTGVGCADH